MGKLTILTEPFSIANMLHYLMVQITTRKPHPKSKTIYDHLWSYLTICCYVYNDHHIWSCITIYDHMFSYITIDHKIITINITINITIKWLPHNPQKTFPIPIPSPPYYLAGDIPIPSHKGSRPAPCTRCWWRVWTNATTQGPAVAVAKGRCSRSGFWRLT